MITTTTTTKQPTWRQPSAARLMLGRLRHAHSAGGLAALGHAIKMARLERRMEILRRAIEHEREVHDDQVRHMVGRLNRLTGEHQQTRIVAVTWLLRCYGAPAIGERHGQEARS